MLVEILIFILTSLLAYYWYIHNQIISHFKSRDVKLCTGVPVFGNVLKSTLLRRHYIEDLDDVYKAFPDERYVGFIEKTKPVVLIRDPELIKKITVKDFDHFVNHKEFFTGDVEPVFGDALIMMKDDRWRDMRNTLTPAFTGSKMKMMMPFMTEISNNIIQDLKEHVNEDINIGDLIHRYSTDVIASAAFGLQVNSIKDKNNEFFKMGQSLFQLSLVQRLYFLLYSHFPVIGKYVNIKIIPDKVINFFRDIVNTTMDYRDKNKVVRPDMIHLLMEAKKGSLTNIAGPEQEEVGFAAVQEEVKQHGTFREWTQDELVGQVFVFFAAGFDTSSSALTMCLHELAINQEVQQKLYQELKSFQEANESLTYEKVGNLKFLDCVVTESLRKWSPAIFMDRVCTKEYELPPPRPGGKPYRIKPGDTIYNIVNSIHMDPKHYPDPQQFDPERFSEDNKHNIRSFTFMPFGMGPRACIGTRFALLEIKVLIYHLILNFKVMKCRKTQDPIKLRPHDFNVSALGGTWVKLETRL